MSQPRLAAWAVAVALVPWQGSGRDRVTFRPAEGTSVTKRFEVRIDVRLDDLSVRLGGEPIDPAALGPGEDEGLRFGYAIGTSDEYREVGDGRPEDLVRTFRELGSWFEDGEAEGAGPGPEDDPKEHLVGRTVRYVWDGSRQTYLRSFVGDDGGEDGLVQLAEDLDLRALLPDGPVARGESWEVGGVALAGVLLPGLDLEREDALQSATFAGLPEGIATGLLEVLPELSATCTYGGARREGEAVIAQVDLAGEIATELDVAPELLGAEPPAEELSIEGARARVRLAFRGTCRWNVGEGRFESFELRGEGTTVLELELRVVALDLPVESDATYAILLERSASARRPD